MLRVGLTGGLASGKSTVAALFRKLGAQHVDADAIARDLVERGGRGYEPVVARFGKGVVGPDGSIDRKALAAIVFRSTSAREDLNGILHPLIREEIAQRIGDGAGSRVVLVDAALLVETGMHRGYDALIVVACSPETQIARAVARGGLTVEEAAARIAAQAPLDVKKAQADFVIDTDGTLAETQRQVREVWRELMSRAG